MSRKRRRRKSGPAGPSTRPAPGRRGKGGGAAALAGCVLLSGAAGLVYEVAWGRQMALFLGITTHAHTAVVCAFLLGLALGAWLLGGIADRYPRPLRLYAWLEGGIGLYAAATPWVFPRLLELYASWVGPAGLTGSGAHVLRFLVALAAMVMPAMLMGGTLPTLVRAFGGGRSSFSAVVGRIYGINTLGAAAGAFSSGFLLLPVLGMRRTVLLAAAANLALAAVVLALDGRRGSREPGGLDEGRAPRQAREEVDGALPPRLLPALALGFAASGCAALVLELAWVRGLTLVVGSSVYAFSATLATYLVGLGAGSLLETQRLSRLPLERRLQWLVWLEAGVGLGALLGIAVITQLPRAFLAGYRAGMHESFVLFQSFTFLLCAAVMLLPTLLLGLLFPLVIGLWPRRPEAPARASGSAYATNTAGTLLGALLGGTVLLPTLGAYRTMILAAGLHTAVAVLFALVRPAPASAQRGQRWQRSLATVVAICVLFVVAVGAAPAWNEKVMTSGPLFHAERMIELQADRTFEELLATNRLLYYGEDADATVTVLETPNELMLAINGKTDASSRGDLPTQVLLGQLPMLAHRDPRQVLVIGLGSGITAGSVATHRSLEHLDIVEISPRVVAASRFFDDVSGAVLDDPRTQLHAADARSFLLAQAADDPDAPEARRYDVIISEPSNPWITGVANLFTREFFALAKERLAPDGVMAQWFQAYQLTPPDLKSLLRTYSAEFDHVSVWLSKVGDLVVLGSEQPHGLSVERVLAGLAEPAVRADLERVGSADVSGLFEHALLSPEQVASFARGGELNRDDLPRIEFRAARALFEDSAEEILTELISSHGGEPFAAPTRDLVTLRGDELVAAGLGIGVETTRTGVEPPPRAQWLLTWKMEPPALAGGEIRVGVGSEQILAWEEAETTTGVTRNVLSSRPSLADLERRLRGLLPLPVAELHETELGDGRPAVGALGRDEGEESAVVGLVWLCPAARDQVAGYVAVRQVPKTDRRSGGEMVADLAARVRCLAEPI